MIRCIGNLHNVIIIMVAMVGKRIKRARSAREDSSICMYMCMFPVPRSQTRNLRSPAVASGQKSYLLERKVSRILFNLFWQRMLLGSYSGISIVGVFVDRLSMSHKRSVEEVLFGFMLHGC